MLRNSVVIILELAFFLAGVLKETGSSSDNYNRHRRQTDEIECTLPTYPENGEWEVIGGEGKPGGKILENSIIKYNCHRGYELSDNPLRLCDENWNESKFPECKELCSSLYSSDTYNVTCFDKNGKEIRCSKATDGSFLNYNCAPFYETPFGYEKTILCEEGKWNSKPICRPVCGKKISKDIKKLIAGSEPNEKLEYPWVAILYIKKTDGAYENICGASILSQTVVLTAAHCVANNNGEILAKENYLIGAGKLYSEYQSTNDALYAQYRNLSKIIVHNNYKGDNRRSLADIAALVVDHEFILNDAIQPVCLNNLKKVFLHVGQTGEVSGWGLTEKGIFSEKLRTLKLFYKYETTCGEELPPAWARTYNIDDKLCAGFINQSKGVCEGDSGNGLAFQNSDGRYYIHGIVTLAPRTDNDECNIQQNALYTRVVYYYDFIDHALSKYAPEVIDCVLPLFPKNGKWTIKNKNKRPGEVVTSNTVLNIECHEDHKLVPQITQIECSSAHIMPKCQAICRLFPYKVGTVYDCKNKQGEVIDCSEAEEGATMTYTCPFKSTTTTTCKRGSWGTLSSDCYPLESPVLECGRDYNYTDLEYPWKAAIYKKIDNYKFICSGSLLSSKHVITAAHCVTDDNAMPLPKKNFRVTTAKAYAKYNVSNDKYTQYSKVENILVHPRYFGASGNYTADIAIITVVSELDVLLLARKLCITRNLLHTGTVGIIPGWKYNPNEPSDNIEIVYEDQQTCTTKFGDLWAHNVSLYDKVCGVISDKTKCLTRDIAGRGLTVKFGYQNYLFGIASKNFITSNECQQNIIFTPVYSYYDFVHCSIQTF